MATIFNFMILIVMSGFMSTYSSTSNCVWAVIVCQLQTKIRAASITQIGKKRYLTPEFGSGLNQLHYTILSHSLSKSLSNSKKLVFFLVFSKTSCNLVDVHNDQTAYTNA